MCLLSKSVIGISTQNMVVDFKLICFTQIGDLGLSERVGQREFEHAYVVNVRDS